MALDQARGGYADSAASFEGYSRGITACLRMLGHEVEEA
jgi:hypothetical protein